MSAGDLEETGPPETIGPYQVLGTLGKGGMGEVLLARDPRLGRRVAIKRIRGDGSPDSRLRFQREARLAASLSHPSIVPIFDLVISGEHEHLVMELVEGPSLARWLEQPRSLGQKLQVAGQIAAGLAYAHRQGIVHRDLKTENVLLSGEQHAKIADFGIARRDRLLAPPGETDGGTELHTREGALLGTYRAMAPEQARGEAADARSDLFSFGVLLFEMFTGESPFQAASPLETLFRLAKKPHPEIAGIAPGLPSALVRLIDQLLEKDARLRPQNAQEVAQRLEGIRHDLAGSGEETWVKTPVGSRSAAGTFAKRLRSRPWIWVGAMVLVAASIAGLGLAWSHFFPAEPLYVAVLKARLLGSSTLDTAEERQLAFTVRYAAQRRLGRLSGISPLSLKDVDDETADRPSPSDDTRIAEALGADHLVAPTISCAGNDCRLVLELWRAGKAGAAASQEGELPTDDPALAGRVTQTLLGGLYPDRQPRDTQDETKISPEALARFLAIRQQLANRPDSGRLEEWLAELQDLRQRNPASTELALLEVELASRRLNETHHEVWRTRATEAMAAALAAAPDEMEVLLKAAWFATIDHRPQDAEGFLLRAEQVAPGDLRIADGRALLLQNIGKPEEAVELSYRSLARRPSWVRSYNLALALMRLGRWEQARTVLDQLLAKVPDHGRALSLRARLDLVAGDPRAAVNRYRRLLTLGENWMDRGNLAVALLLVGDGEAASRESEKSLAAAPGNTSLMLIAAETRLLDGNKAGADDLYRQIVALLAGGKDVTNLTVKAQALARLGEYPQAIAAIQQALAQPSQYAGQLAIEAALVYSYAGERNSALSNIQLAVEAGRGGWLRLPGFAVWQDDPEIGPLLSAKGPLSQPGSY